MLPIVTGNGNVFTGGVNDGHSFAVLPVATGNGNIFTGGVNDGFSTATLPLSFGNNNIFNGGNDDGHSFFTLNFVTPGISIVPEQSDTICAGSPASFIATPVEGGDSPVYEWYHNNVLVGTSNDTVVLAGFTNGDSLYCKLISSLPNALPDTVQSNVIYITVLDVQNWYADVDGDGYGNIASQVADCRQPTGFVANSTDCDDTNPGVHQRYPFYADADGDGFGAGPVQRLCTADGNTAPPGYSTNANDCDDNDPAVYPGSLAPRYLFRKVQNGLWHNPLVWEYFDGCNWGPAGTSPDSSAGKIEVKHYLTVTQGTHIDIDELEVGSGGTIYFPDPSYDTVTSFVIHNGPGDDCKIQPGGTIIVWGANINGTGSIINNGGWIFSTYNDGNSTHFFSVDVASFANNGHMSTNAFYDPGCCVGFEVHFNNTELINNGTIDFTADFGVPQLALSGRRLVNTNSGSIINYWVNTNQYSGTKQVHLVFNEFQNDGLVNDYGKGITINTLGNATTNHNGKFTSASANGITFETNGVQNYTSNSDFTGTVTRFRTGTHNINGAYIPGTTYVESVVNFHQPEIVLKDVVLSAGNLGGPAIKKMSSNFSWWAGTLSGGNTIITDSAIAYLGAGQTSLGVLATTLVNNGTVNVSTGYGGCCIEPSFNMSNGTIENNAQFVFNSNGGGGVRNLAFDGGTFNNNAGGTILNNAQVSSGYGDNATYLRNNVLTNNGIILNNGVSLNIFPATGGTINGIVTTASGSQTRFGVPATTITFGDSSVVDGAGKVIFREGKHQVNCLQYDAGSTQIGEGNTTAEVYFNMPAVNLNNMSVSNSIMGGNAVKLLKDDLFIVNGEISGGAVTTTDTSSVVFYNINRVKTSFTSNNFTGIYADYGGCCSGGSLDLNNGGSLINNGLIDLTGYGGIRQMGIDNGNFENNGTLNVHFSAFGNITRLQPATFTNNGTINHQLGRIEMNAFTLGGIINTTAGSELASSGTLTFNGSLINNDGNFLAPLNLLTPSSKTIKGNGTFSSTMSANENAIVMPGGVPGILTIAGNYNQGGAALTIEIGGTTPGAEHDRLVVTGAAVLSGTLNAAQINGFDPQSFTSIDILTASSVTGTFSQVNLPAFWSVKYFSNRVSLVKFVTNVYYRDADADGFGNIADTIIRYETTAPAGYTSDSTDCHDGNFSINPAALEVCNGIDDNCDGYVDTVLMDGLVLYMPLDGTAVDKSQNGLNGTIAGTVVAGTDRFGNPAGAMIFNGNQNNHIRINDNPLLRPSSITLSAWVYIASQRSPSSFITKSINCFNDSWHFGTEGSSYSTWVSNSTNCGDFVQMTSPYTERVWKHVAYTLDAVADTRKMYVDGTLVASGAYTSSIPYDGNPVLIGAAIENGALDFPFIGSLDDVMIFNRAISAGEVTKLFTDGSPLTALNTRFYADADGDGFGNPALSQVACSQPPGFTLNNTDCDDTHNTVYPGAPEICDGLDNDCNGYTDSTGITGFVCATTTENGSLTITAPEGLVFSSVEFASYGTPNGDCGNFTIGSCHAGNSLSIVQGLVIGQHSASIPASNGLFGDPCSGTAKRLYVQARYSSLQPLTRTYYADSDGDGFGNPGASTNANCGAAIPDGYVSNNTDCDDANANVNPLVSPGVILGVPTMCAGSTNPFTSTGTPGGTWISRNPEIATVDANGLVTAISNGITKIVYQVNDCTLEGKTDSVFVNVAAQYVWTGAGANADWNNVSNWTSCGVPPHGANVTISDAVNKPSLNIDVAVGDLVLAGNASILLNERIFTINGSVTGTGTLSATPASSLVAAGNAGTIQFSPGKDTIKQIMLLQNAALTIGSRLYVKAGAQPGEIRLQQGSVLNAIGNLTLLSDINGTARVAEVPVDASGNALATINGDVVVERFIPKNVYKAWQLLSVPTKGLQTIKQSWQENQPAGVTGITGYGTRITSGPGFGANGFDGTSTKASIQSYNPANGQLVYLTSTLNPAATSNGYYLFVRGDRSVGISGNNLAVNATKLRTKGTLYLGDQPPVSSVASNRHFMVGNIYPSSIDFARLPRTGGVGSTFYLWDPKLNNGVTLGAYQTFSATNGYAPVIPGGSYTSPNSLIQSGQAFYAFAGSSPGTIQMIEAAKTDGTANSVFRPAKRSATIDAKLIAFVHDSAFTADAHHLAFDGQFANEVDEMDAIKIINPGAGISSQVSEQLLAIDTRTSILLQDSIQYHLSNLHRGKYQLQFQFASVAEQGTAVYLKDSYLNRVISLDCTASAGYSFTVDNDAASGASNRFVLLFTQKKNIPFADAADQKLQVNPNPAAGGYFNLVLTAFPKGRFHLKLLSARGEVVLVRSGEATAGNSTIRVELEKALAAGVYIVEFIDVNNRRFSESLIIK